MLILTIRTDKPVAEIGLYDDHDQLAYFEWEAHRQLAETIHLKINELLQGHAASLRQIRGIVAFKGPGSFTGLRIGLSVANAFSDGLSIPIVGAVGNDWILSGITSLLSGKNEQVVEPEYGAPVNITLPKK